MELYSMLRATLDGRGFWGRTDTSICMTESLSSSHETVTIKVFFFNKNRKKSVMNHKKKIGLVTFPKCMP